MPPSLVYASSRPMEFASFNRVCARVLIVAAVTAWASAVAVAAEERSYTADLAMLYNEYQRVLTLRDACMASQPAKRDDFSGAYEDWFARHERIVDDLDNR